jgi:2-haloacid dehalogenase
LFMGKMDNLKPVIVFDFGGVLMDWSPYYLYRKILADDQEIERFLKDVDFYVWNQEHDRGRSVADGAAELASRFPQYRDLILAYDERYLESVGGAIQPSIDILHALKNAGYPLYGLSNWPTEKFALVRPIYPFFEWFDDIIISGEVGLIKPDKPIFELLLERIGCPAGDCLYIDDHERNIKTAQDLGFQTIHFQSPPQFVVELHQLGILDGFDPADF